MIYRVTYQSMTAFYGPWFIEAEDEYQAKRIFASKTFSANEMGCIKAVPVSLDEIVKYTKAKP